MSRSRHHGCGGSCGACRPHKAFRGRNWTLPKHRVERADAESLRSLTRLITRDLARNGHHLRVVE